MRSTSSRGTGTDSARWSAWAWTRPSATVMAGSSTANSSPPRRATSPAAWVRSRSPLAMIRRSPALCPSVSLTSLKSSRSSSSTTPRASSRVMAALTASLKARRFGSPDKGSCNASWARCSTICSRRNTVSRAPPPPPRGRPASRRPGRRPGRRSRGRKDRSHTMRTARTPRAPRRGAATASRGLAGRVGTPLGAAVATATATPPSRSSPPSDSSRPLGRSSGWPSRAGCHQAAPPLPFPVVVGRVKVVVSTVEPGPCVRQTRRCGPPDDAPPTGARARRPPGGRSARRA